MAQPVNHWKEAEWQEIKDEFSGTLLIGNGSSQAIFDGFSYKNIFAQASELGNITEEVKGIFDNFETEDFELVLRHLWHASIVNECLGIHHGKVNDAYKNVRDALIKTVHSIHAPYEEAMKHFESIGNFVRQFKNIISLNYDLLLYWVIMHENNKAHKDPVFKDCFINGRLTDDLDDLYNTMHGWGHKSTCLVAYPHGSLFIGSMSSSGIEKKITTKSSRNLLDEITQYWESEMAIPVFVSEATSEKKMASVRQSNYLTRVFYEVLPYLMSSPEEHDGSLTIFGWSLSEQDNHILKQLARNDFERVAVSYRTRDPERFNAIAAKLTKNIKNVEVVFYPSSSQGAWNAPLEVMP